MQWFIRDLGPFDKVGCTKPTQTFKSVVFSGH